MFPRDKKTLPTSIGPIEAQVSTGKNVVTFRDFEEKNIIKKKKKKPVKITQLDGAMPRNFSS
jgi:hypothetical protein